jgi:TP901 family phage tail tape measure protein
MSDGDINAKIELDAAQFLKTLNKIISDLADLPRETAAAASAIDKLERQATGLAAAFSKSTGSIVGQKAAIESLTSSYQKLGLAQLKGAGTVARELKSAFTLAGSGNSMSEQLGLKPLNQNLQNVAGTIRTMNSLYDQQNKIRLAGARAVNGADQPDKAGFIAAQKQAQAAAYRSYQSNIAYSKSVEQLNAGLANQRYALYDVASSLTVVSLATLGAAAAATKFAIDYQSNFASVARTTGAIGAPLQALRDQLIGLSTELPTSFQDITEIATLGAQLGVATSGLDDFTEVVAKLTATTNLSSEAAGTALGRFDALFSDIDPSKFENLGSAILKVGVNSVATESQIVNTGIQISSMGDFAGLTAQQVIGLSGALASVGAQPELSRGTVTRVFTVMSKAISEGGDALNEFARLSNVSAAEFQASWGTERFASVFQRFLAGVAQEGQGAVQTLNDLGISSVRDVPLLLRLASAHDVVTQSFSDAASGFRDGTELNKQYAITAETVAAKLTMLGNTIKAIIEAPGSAALGPLAGFLDAVQGLAKGILTLASTGAGKVIGTIVIALSALIGVLTGLKAVQALVTASSYAFITAQASLEKQGLGSTTAMGSLTKQMLLFTVGTSRATAATTAFNAAQAQGAGKLASLAAGARAGVTAVGGLAAAGRAAAISFGWLTAIGVGIAALTAYAQKQQEAKVQVEALTDSLDEQSGAITDVTEKTVYKSLVDDGTIARAKELGLNLQTVLQAALGNKSAIAELQAVQEGYNQTLIDAQEAGKYYSTQFQDEKEARSGMAIILENLGAQTEMVTNAQEAFGDSTRAGVTGLQDEADAAQDAVSGLQELLDTQYELVGGTVAVQNALYGLGSSLGENGLDFSAYSVAGRANLAALQSALSAMVTASGGDATALATMIGGLMQSLAALGVDTVNQLGFVQNALAQLTGGKGVAGLPGLGQAANSAGHALGQGFSVGANKAAKAANKAAKGAKKAAKEVVTLTDYVNDLSNVFQNAFDIRFGLEKSLDSVAEGWQKMRDSADDAREAIADATQQLLDSDATIQGLQAANQTLEYQLTVAQQYGDVLRANEILAEMAKNNAELSDEQKKRVKTEKDLTKAQQAALPSLDGQTEGSREQRDMVLGLVKSYQDQVLALANTGLSQQEVARRTQELKNQFVAQLVQMGYNRSEVERYAVAFDDLTRAIQQVPRDITVSANTDPAQRAIDEFIAKNQNRNLSVGSNVSGDGYQAGVANGNAYGDGWVAAVNAKRRIIQRADNNVPGGMTYSGDGGKTWFFNKGGIAPEYHARGGSAGHPGGPKGSDTVPAWLTPGEAVTQKPAVDYYGLPFMNALNNMQIPKYLSTGGPARGRSSASSAPGIQLVELLPTQLQQLAQIVSTSLSIDGKMIGEAANNANSVLARRGSN